MVITRRSMDNFYQTVIRRIRTLTWPRSAASLAVCSIPRFVAISLLLLFLPSVYAQEHCKPLIPVADLPGGLPCAANIIGGNESQEMNPLKAIEQAREVLWDRFTRQIPSFMNLEVASKEGARTRVVYVLERIPDSESLVLQWFLQRQVIDVAGKTSRWSPIENFRATTIIRDKTGVLTFKNGADVVAHL